MQKWEYAQVYWYQGQRDPETLNIVYYLSNGVKRESVEEKGVFSKKPDFSAKFESVIIQMGLEGWEISASLGATDREWWFKRPLA